MIEFKKWLLYIILNLKLFSFTVAIPVVIMTIDKTDIVDEETTDLKSLLRSEDSFYIDGECVSRKIFYDDIDITSLCIRKTGSMCGQDCNLLLTGLSKSEILQEAENLNHQLVIPPVFELVLSNK